MNTSAINNQKVSFERKSFTSFVAHYSDDRVKIDILFNVDNSKLLYVSKPVLPTEPVVRSTEATLLYNEQVTEYNNAHRAFRQFKKTNLLNVVPYSEIDDYFNFYYNQIWDFVLDNCVYGLKVR